MHRNKIFQVTIIALAIILPASVLSACAKAPKNEVPPGREFTLSIGQSAAISSENITIKFIDVTSDSRCPQNVTCIWAGEVSCTVEITRPGASLLKLKLTQPGLTSQLSTQDFDGHTIAFRVEPYPTAGKTIARSDYRLIMTVTGNRQ
ncbi:MAG: hypothetical protein ABR958_05355 [Dehalococcoidales bacterium]